MPDASMPPVGVLGVVRFAAEVAMLVGLGIVGAGLGAGLGGGPVVEVALAVILPVVAATVWGIWVAPRSTRRLADPNRLLVELGLFGCAVVGLVWQGHVVPGVVLAVLYLVSTRHGRAGG